MESFFIAFNAVMPMVLLAVIGYLMKLKGYFSDSNIGALNKACFQVFLPILTFRNISNSDIKSIFDLSLVFFACAIVIITIIVSIFVIPIFTKDKKNQGSLIQAIYRSNYVILGLPIAYYLGGDLGQQIASTLIMVIIPLYNVSAVIILSIYGGSSLNKKVIFISIIKNPLIISSILGIIVSLLGIQFPSFINATIKNFASLGSIMPMLVLGASINLSRVTANKKLLIIGMVSKLIVVPMIFIPISIFLGYTNEKFIGLLIMLTAPPAVSSAVMAKEMGCNFELSTQLVVFSTILSSLTVFFWIFLVSYLKLI